MVVFFIFFCKACKNTIYFFNPGSTILQNKNKQHLTNKNNHEMHCFLVKFLAKVFFDIFAAANTRVPWPSG